jgi:hypothetical protein
LYPGPVRPLSGYKDHTVRWPSTPSSADTSETIARKAVNPTVLLTPIAQTPQRASTMTNGAPFQQARLNTCWIHLSCCVGVSLLVLFRTIRRLLYDSGEGYLCLVSRSCSEVELEDSLERLGWLRIVTKEARSPVSGLCQHAKNRPGNCAKNFKTRKYRHRKMSEPHTSTLPSLN